MDPATIHIVAKAISVSTKVSQGVIVNNALNRINDKLNKIIAKQDQDILSRLRSAFDAIYDALASSNAETRRQRLFYAENGLLPNTQLNLNIETAGLRNGYWIALANYGLALICLLRDDNETAARHVIRMFGADPRFSRALFPAVYADVFKPQCASVYAWAEKRRSKIMRSNFTGKIIANRAGLVATTAIAAAAVVYAGNTPPPAALMAFKDAWTDVTRDKFRPKALKMLSIEIEDKIDERCKEIANTILVPR